MIFACSRCGHRAEVAVDTGAEAFVSPEARLDPANLVAVSACPSCGRRSWGAVAARSLVAIAGGAGVAVVGALPLVLVGMMLAAGPDPRENDARFPWILAVAILLSTAAGAGFAAVLVRRLLRRAALAVTFRGAAPEGAAAVSAKAPSIFADDDQRSRVATGIVGATGVLLGLARFMGWGAPLGALLGLGVLAGAVGGVIRGTTPRARVIFALSFVVGEVGIIVATILYVAGRTSVYRAELVLPMVGGALPGVVAYLVASRLLAAKRDPFEAA